jgi:hypothetical protein
VLPLVQISAPMMIVIAAASAGIATPGGHGICSPSFSSRLGAEGSTDRSIIVIALESSCRHPATMFSVRRMVASVRPRRSSMSAHISRSESLVSAVSVR